MPRILPWLALFCLPVTAVGAEVFVLSHGGQIEGKLLNTDQSPRETYVVQTSRGEITLTAEQVEEVIRKSAAESHYEQLLPRMPATADGNWKMAEWCGKYRLGELRERHLEAVLQYQPEHKEARYALGYSRIDGAWVRPNEYMEGRGFVRHKGAWRLPQEIALEEATTDVGQQEIDWRKRLKMWRTWIVKARSQKEEGIRNLRALKDPLAAPGLADLIDDEEFPAMKILLMETLGRLQTRHGVEKFAHLAVHDADRTVRDKAIDQLREFGGSQAVPILVRGLSEKDNVLVNRAAIALGSIADPAATVPLIDALSTKHKFIVNTGGGGGLNLGFSNDGGGGLSTGGGPKLVEQELQNRGVLEALTAIHRGVNYQYDKKKWKDWYAERQAPQVVNLRRDP